MLLLDAAARGGAVAILLLLAGVLWRDGRRTHNGWTGCLLTLSAVAYAVESARPIAALSFAEAPWLVPVRLVSMGTPALFWIFSAACFDDEFRPSWRHALPWLAGVGLAALCLFMPSRWLWWGYSALQLAFVGMAVWHAVIGRHNDLIEARRRFRLVMTAVVALYVVVLVVSNLSAQRVEGPAAAKRDAESWGLLALAVIVAGTRLTLHRQVQIAAAGGHAAMPSAPVLSAAVEPAVPSPADPADTALLPQLNRLMEHERCYREDGFGIATLAARMAIPEYRLRRLINQQLGHRNFTAFVNGYRLAEAEAALADPTQDEVPILTIALDAGFQSVGPFNRAFKARTGLTPSEFRRLRGRPTA